MTSASVARCRHQVAFLHSDKDVVESACDYIAAGEQLSQRAVLAVDAGHERAIRAELASRGLGRLAKEAEFVSAEGVADALTRGGAFAPEAFSGLVRPVVERAAAASGGHGARVFGEIVSVLWRRGQESEAAALERLWEELARSVRFSLFCGYMIDLLECRCDVWPLVEAHDGVLPSLEMRRSSEALERAVEGVLGGQSAMVRALVSGEKRLAGMPFGEAALLWLGRHMPLVARRVVGAARV